ncbi:DNA helicase IV [Vibrio sp. OCN044]|uniref:DNA 3'-5' helicase n=1 Tax=Vibrio tetraodonis subsp. pristinus TaxID=2695891 RepID=A0A6L8LYZ8_9VIBR|nr:DNA helicase IV [Vibrio tetraodonis]MYM60336.1 DNA helicase IV [Vibrio tetraodonis subsp. pristinus]
MQLTATKTAQYLIQNEYNRVSLESDVIILSSKWFEEHIPFSVWNGEVNLKRGLIWGGLQFFSHPKDGSRQSWLIEGLSWQSCRQFARLAVDCYQKWHNKQCQQLYALLPQWEMALQGLERQPAYLTHSTVDYQLAKIFDDLKTAQMTLEDAVLMAPQKMANLVAWVTDTENVMQLRNQRWMEIELENWKVLFSQIESSPLNLSQQQAVLLNDDTNLVLAGAGSGKTSVLTARVAYLLQSHLAQSEEILMLAFGRDAAYEMRQRLENKIGLSADEVKVNTFHQLALAILNDVEGSSVTISPIATDDNLKNAWCMAWLKNHWASSTAFKRWQKHLKKWPIAYITGDDELASHAENPKLINWLAKQLEQLSALGSTKKDIQEKLVTFDDYTRLNSELALVWPCYQAWMARLSEEGNVDFNIMISKATEYVEKGKYKPSWKYIMIDEYQDISPKRLQLVEALCNQKRSPNCVLFAVGDDWQSIYQFAGADVDLTTGFAKRFRYSTVHRLDTTYRFNNQIGEVANQFIQRNPSQLIKKLQSYKQKKSKSVTLSESSSVEKILEELNRKAKSTQSVLLLARNHYHKPELLPQWQKQFALLSIDFMTCHASKGREADYVIILCVDEGQFPPRVKSLHIDGALTQSTDPYPYAEERRLFYVALTRAKKHVWVTYSGSGSCFIHELKDQDYPVNVKKRGV